MDDYTDDQTPDDAPDELLRELAQSYHEPPATPREEIWHRIRAAQRSAGATVPTTAIPLAAARARRPGHRGWRGAVLIGLAALVALGVAVGRWTAPASPPASAAPPTSSAAVAPPRGDVAYRLVTAQYLGQSEAFLTLFRTSVRGGRTDRLASATARQLLASNRLLLDSRAAADPKTRALLEDLELVLAGIAQLAPGSERQDLDLITGGIERGDVLLRLRAAVPAGSPAISSQGAL